MLVTVPIGSWIASLLFDIASHVVNDPRVLAEGSVWLIAIGVIGALAAALPGLVDLLAIPDEAFGTARAHLSINLLVIFAYVGNFLWRYRTHSYHAPVGLGMLGLSAVCIGALAVSGYLGGKLSYQYGVRFAAADRAARAKAGYSVSQDYGPPEQAQR
jgi:uncharacterized membrane protein